jgi:ABC-type antimicrobial peptide transport system permease subunit
MILVGLALGIAGVFVLTRAIESLLFGVSALDPVALGAACAAMLAIGLLAGFVPARRAARVDPMSVLREEG